MARASLSPAAGFTRQGKPNSPRPITPAQRRRIEELVSHLIGILDEADGDPDLEPSLGWSRTMAQGVLDTSELLHDLEEDEAEREPWTELAWLDTIRRARVSDGP